MLASLNHPNIAAVYGLEESDGLKALVMELVEGATLAERITRAAVPAAEAIGIARDRGRLGGRAREGHRPPRSQAREHPDSPDSTVKVLDWVGEGDERRS